MNKEEAIRKPGRWPDGCRACHASVQTGVQNPGKSQAAVQAAYNPGTSAAETCDPRGQAR